jgi:hypothetical protein
MLHFSAAQFFCGHPKSMAYSWRDKSYSYMKYIGHMNQNNPKFWSRSVFYSGGRSLPFFRSSQTFFPKKPENLGKKWPHSGRAELQLNASKSETVRTTRMSDFFKYVQYLVRFFIL